MGTIGEHLVVVEAYEGRIEALSVDAEERRGSFGLGLPIEEIADRLDARVTLLGWDAWQRYEGLPGSFFERMPMPVTRTLRAPGPAVREEPVSGRLRFREIPARDPEDGRPFASGLSPRLHGILAESDPLFLASYCLAAELASLNRADPIRAVIVPMWGGSGYVAQLAEATGACKLRDAAFVVVATDTSATRQRANGEGLWTRPAITRRQMEDLSLALADLVVVFGSRGERKAVAGRLPESSPPVHAPRFVPPALLDAIAVAAETGRKGPLQLFLEEPQDGASGVLTALDAVAALHARGVRLDRPLISAGPNAKFAPMKPRDFVEYWSSRGFVRELMAARQWEWAERPPRRDGSLPIRLYPSLFEHLPEVWTELARESLVLASPAAADGLAPGERLPFEALLAEEPDASVLASRLQSLVGTGVDRLEAVRRELCARVVAGHRGEGRERLLERTVGALRQLLTQPVRRPDVGRAALLLLDRRQTVSEIAGRVPWRPHASGTAERPGTLTVVVVCYETGELIREAVESVWRSERLPDEVLLVDDGSEDEATRACIQTLEREATNRRLPLRVVRQKNRGLANARNVGLAAATGEYISFLDGDDLIEPAFYGRALRLIEQNPDLGGVAAWAELFGDRGPDGFWNAPQPELPLLLVENTVIVPCMARTAVLRELGGYDPRLRFNYEDWELSIRMLASGRPIVTIPAYLQRYRVRPDSLFRTMSDVQNQGMRELLLEIHRETVSRFAMETTMQLEHRLMKHLYARSPLLRLSTSGERLLRWARGARAALARAVGTVRTR